MNEFFHDEYLSQSERKINDAGYHSADSSIAHLSRQTEVYAAEAPCSDLRANREGSLRDNMGRAFNLSYDGRCMGLNITMWFSHTMHIPLLSLAPLGGMSKRLCASERK